MDYQSVGSRTFNVERYTMSKSPKTTTTKTVKELPSQFQPFLDQYAQQIQQQLDSGQSLIAPLTQLQQTALNTANTIPTMDNLNAAYRLQGDTIAGNYLNANPYLQNVLDSTNQDITNNYNKVASNIDVGAAREGIFGGSAWKQQQNEANATLVDQLSENENKLRYGDYSTERANQINAANNAPAFSGNTLSYLSGLYGLGTNEQNQQNALNNEQLNMLRQALEVGYNGASTNSTAPNPNYVSPLQSLVGIGITAAGLPMGGGATLLGSYLGK